MGRQTDRRNRSALLTALAVAGVLALAGCNRSVETKGSILPTATNHVSPPPVEVPRLPAGTFDQAQSRTERGTAVSLRKAGDAAAARTHAEKAALLWPADQDAWTELATDCTALQDLRCQRYTAFFQAKIDFVSTLPPRMAVLGFASLNAAGIGTKAGDYIYDQQTLDTALRLASFYDEQDQLRDARLRPTKAASPK